MSYDNLIFDILSTVATLVLPFVVAYVVKWLNVHIGEKRTNIILQDVRMVVQSVQQLADSGQIPKDNKYLEAFDYIQKHYKDLPADKISHLIESAVKDMKDWGPNTLPAPVTDESIKTVPIQSTPINSAATI